MKPPRVPPTTARRNAAPFPSLLIGGHSRLVKTGFSTHLIASPFPPYFFHTLYRPSPLPPHRLPLPPLHPLGALLSSTRRRLPSLLISPNFLYASISYPPLLHAVIPLPQCSFSASLFATSLHPPALSTHPPPSVVAAPLSVGMLISFRGSYDMEGARWTNLRRVLSLKGLCVPRADAAYVDGAYIIIPVYREAPVMWPPLKY